MESRKSGGGSERLVGAPGRRRYCSRGGWILCRAEREYNCEFNGNGKFNGNYGGCGGDGEPGGVEGAAG